ncbi:MAG: NUDIX domain-containing protein [Candidatus Levybacteria bacterium]|nr:NUDIX domain-containing protein [Candidatus Levybacteria bacterium]
MHENHPNEGEQVIPTVAAVIFCDGKVLLVTHGEGSGHVNGVMGLPSGHVEDGEGELVAAIREIQEETGLLVDKSSIHEFEGNYFIAKILRKDGVTRTYGWRVYKVEDFEGKINEGSEEVIPQWVSIQEITALDAEGKLLPNVSTAINNALKSKVTN